VVIWKIDIIECNHMCQCHDRCSCPTLVTPLIRSVGVAEVNYTKKKKRV